MGRHTHILPSLPSLLLLLCSNFAISISNTKQTYIVQVQNDLQPSIFPDIDHWYTSILTTLSSSTLLHSDDDARDGDTGGSFIHVYRTVFHGFSAKLTSTQAKQLSTIPGVLAVHHDKSLQLHTTHTPQFLGLINPQAQPRGLLVDSDYGSNTIIGIFDTGITPERRCFHDDGLGPPPSHWKGTCEDGAKSFCNNKIIGARSFSSTGNSSTEPRSPLDLNGHGTHTSSTAAGHQVPNASFYGYAGGIASGIAPKARIAVYKIFWSNGCFSSDLVAAFDKAVEDGVDIISLSVGGGAVEYDSDPIAIAAFGAMEKGVLVSASAGNEGPGMRTVVNIAPWITTVGAGTIDRSFPADVVLGDGRVVNGTSVYGGGPFPPSDLVPLVYAGDVTKVGSAAPFCMYGTLDPDKVRGKIVMCDRGGAIPRTQKAFVVKEAGGVALIIANLSPDGEDLIPDSHVLPEVSVRQKEGYEIREYTRSNNSMAMLRFHGTQMGSKPAPILASFSSRGPNGVSPFIIKPDMVAPGVGILASWTDQNSPTGLLIDGRRPEFNIMSGTSMSCPHVSGLASLLKSAHPDWSPAAIRSAMMTTAYTKDNLGNEILDESTGITATLWGVGSGHIDPERANNPGLVYDMTVEDYVDFLCGSNYTSESVRRIARREVNCMERVTSPLDLNYPSISVVFDQSRPGKLEATAGRTVTNVHDGGSTYTVNVVSPEGASMVAEPRNLVFGKKGEKKGFTVKVSAERVALGGWSSKTSLGALTWSDGVNIVRSPVAVTWQLHP